MALMRAWQYTATAGGMDKNLQLKSDVPKPTTETLARNEVLVEILAVGLNPADYKVPEMRIGKLLIGTTAVPGTDYSGRVAATHATNNTLNVGQLVFGRIEVPKPRGTLAQYAVASQNGCVPLPEGLNINEASTIGTAGATAYQSIVPYLKSGQKIFINGGSGGCGTFGIQFAKAVGAHVTTSCSTKNILLCKELGADEIVDYTKGNLVDVLKAQGQTFDLVVDNVGADRALYLQGDKYMKPGAHFVQVGAPSSLGTVGNILCNMVTPGFLGGGKRPFVFVRVANNPEDFIQIGKWMAEGKVKPIIQSVFPFEDAIKAFEELRTERTKGKIVVQVQDPAAIN
jgi:NADPH:quinone reductase-like Zn-dependent oxidoreductase